MNDKWNFRTLDCEGKVARQAHVDLPDGAFERELGRDGFAGASTHLYHRNPPTAWMSFAGPLRPRAFNTLSVKDAQACPWQALPLLATPYCRVRFWRSSGQMRHLVRNADGDDLLFLHRGQAEFFCDYGHMRVSEGDYVLIPRGTMWRLEGVADVLMVEATGGQYRFPDRGLLGRYALFDPAVLTRPTLDREYREQPRNGRWEIRVKRRGEISLITYPFNPLDTIGWRGDLYPIRANIRDFCPVTSHRAALPPSVHTSFETGQFMVGSVVPRPFETDPRAMKLPWFHNNDDYDEMMFLHRGQFSSRGGILAEGGITLHPAGCTHGPHPETLSRMYDAQGMFEGWLVMIDSREPFDVDPRALESEAPGYAESWQAAIRLAPDAAMEPVDT